MIQDSSSFRFSGNSSNANVQGFHLTQISPSSQNGNSFEATAPTDLWVNDSKGTLYLGEKLPTLAELQQRGGFFH